MRKMLGVVGCLVAACSSFSSADTPSTPDGPDAAVETPDATVPAEAGETSSAYTDAVMADTPVAYWKMDDTAGLVVPDHTGNKHDLILVGGGHTVVDGIDDHAIQFDGKKSGANALGSAAFDFAPTHAFTIECWATFSDPTKSNGLFLLMGYSTGQGGNRAGYLLYVNNSVPAYDRDEGHTNNNSIGGVTIPDEAFHHYVVVYDVNMTLWVDGQSVRTQPAPYEIPSLGTTFSVGYDQGNSAFSYAGAIDEAAVYDHALTPDNIGRHFVARLKSK